MGETRTGFMLLADISGYTGYLGDSELEHARETLGALLEVLVKGARPPLTFSKLEGDAVFSYTEDSNLLVGQTLVEIVETTYIGFRRAIDLMVLNNTCGCRACTNVATLDLKFFVHHGTFSTLEAGGRVDLVGSDVVVPHRMAKNRIPETTDISAYTAYTDSAIERLGRELIEGMTRVVLEYDDLGEVVVWVSDMHQVWEDKKGEPIIELSDEETALSIDIEIDLPVEVVWDYLADVEFRKVFIGSDRQEVVDRRRGRVAPGSTYQCFHGSRVVPQVVLEWRPFERIATRDRISTIGGGFHVVGVYGLRPRGSGTILNYRCGAFTGPTLLRAIGPTVIRRMRRQFVRDGEEFRQAIVDDFAKRGLHDRELTGTR